MQWCVPLSVVQGEETLTTNAACVATLVVEDTNKTEQTQPLRWWFFPPDNENLVPSTRFSLTFFTLIQPPEESVMLSFNVYFWFLHKNMEATGYLLSQCCRTRNLESASFWSTCLTRRKQSFGVLLLLISRCIVVVWILLWQSFVTFLATTTLLQLPRRSFIQSFSHSSQQLIHPAATVQQQ